MSFVSPRFRAGSDVPTVHTANAVYALNEVRARRGGLVAGGVLWGRVVRVCEVVPVGTSRVLEVGVLVGGIGPGVADHENLPHNDDFDHRVFVEIAAHAATPFSRLQPGNPSGR